MVQIINIIGAAFVLGAFIALQVERFDRNDISYILMNLVGSSLLATAAAIENLWGFFVLNTVWAVVSLRSLVTKRPAPAPPADG